jgi:hypothetical protein
MVQEILRQKISNKNVYIHYKIKKLKIPWNRLLLQMLTVASLVIKFPANYGIQDPPPCNLFSGSSSRSWIKISNMLVVEVYIIKLYKIQGNSGINQQFKKFTEIKISNFYGQGKLKSYRIFESFRQAINKRPTSHTTDFNSILHSCLYLCNCVHGN